MPTGTIGCVVLNIPGETITRLDAPCTTLNQLLTGIGLKNVDMQILPKAQEAGQAVIHTLLSVQAGERWDIVQRMNDGLSRLLRFRKKLHIYIL